MLDEPLPDPGQFGGVVIYVLGEPSPAVLEEPRASHRGVASMTLRVS